VQLVAAESPSFTSRRRSHAVSRQGSFRSVARPVLRDEQAQGALTSGTARLREGRLRAWSAQADIDALRARGRDIRTRTIADLDRHLAAFADALTARGGAIHRTATAAEAAETVVEICKAADAKLVAKSKSMATEEIGLIDALQNAGLRIVETDLGDYLMQIRGEHPEHIVVPAIRLTRADAAAALEVGPEMAELMDAARRRLRRVFETADVAVTGANFAVAETGSICLVTNEGNADLLTAFARVHVVVLGMERVVPTLAELATLLRLLASSATGERLTTYTTLLSGPRRAEESDGPEELHVVVVDNGRSALRGGRYAEMLNCIRCGACLNVCPVYRKTGGRAYSEVYSGPMGAVLVPLLSGLERTPDLPHASSLCGACTEACPVGIPLHELLLRLRRDLVEQHIASPLERIAFQLWALAWSSVAGYRASTFLARLARPLAPLLGAGKRWSNGREVPRLARRRFRDSR
jgi:L-lactate dehydrogenase complex protein LldF